MEIDVLPASFLRYLRSTQNRPLLLDCQAPQAILQQVQSEQNSTDTLPGKEEAIKADWPLGIADRVQQKSHVYGSQGAVRCQYRAGVRRFI
jgi:hypothetical protein